VLGLQRHAQSREQAAAAGRNDDEVRRSDLSEHLKADCALACDDLRLIEG
jgi:hypothetical protein